MCNISKNQIIIISEQQSETEVLNAHALELVDKIVGQMLVLDTWRDVRDIKMPEVNAGAYIVAKIVVLWVELSGSKVSIMIKILPQMKLLKQWKGHFYEFPLLCWSFNWHFSNTILIWVGRNLDSGLDSRGHQNGTQVLLQ